LIVDVVQTFETTAKLP